MIVQVLVGVAAVLLLASALLVLYRIAAGPDGLDRVVASDVGVAILIAAVAAEAIWNRNETGLPLILVLSLLGFTGPVAMARLAALSRARDRRFRDAESAAEREGKAR